MYNLNAAHYNYTSDTVLIIYTFISSTDGSKKIYKIVPLYPISCSTSY